MSQFLKDSNINPQTSIIKSLNTSNLDDDYEDLGDEFGISYNDNFDNDHSSNYEIKIRIRM